MSLEDIAEFIDCCKEYTETNKRYPSGTDVICDRCGKHGIELDTHYGYKVYDMCRDCFTQCSLQPTVCKRTSVDRSNMAIYHNADHPSYPGCKIISTDPEEAKNPDTYVSNNPYHILTWSKSDHLSDDSVIGQKLPSNPLTCWVAPDSKLCFIQMQMAINDISLAYFNPAISHYSVSERKLNELNDKLRETIWLTDKHRFMTLGFIVFCACCGKVGLKMAVGYNDCKYTGLIYDICIPCCREFVRQNQCRGISFAHTVLDYLNKIPIGDDYAECPIPSDFEYTFKRLDFGIPVKLAKFSDRLPTWRLVDY
jgi:hypothetical protein